MTTTDGMYARLALAYAAAAVCVVVAAVRHPVLRAYAAGYAGLLAQLAAMAAAYPFGGTTSVVAASATAVILAAAAAWRSRHPEEIALAAGWVLAVATAIGYAFGVPQGFPNPLIAAALVAAGLTAFGYGLLPARGYVAVVGVLLCSAAAWTLLADRNITTVEAYTLPLAALAAVVGLARLHRDRSAPSWLTVGPALSAGLLPSAVVSVGDETLTRPLLVLVAGAAVLVGGVAARWQSPVVTGALALLIVSVSQLGPYAVGLPRWLTFGAVGLFLLVLGARYEQRLLNARQAARWMAGLR